MSYAILHQHTGCSLKDSLADVGQIFERAKELGASAVAITDHGNMMAMYDAQRAAKKTGLKYIVGVESYIREDDEKHRRHLIIMAKTQEGYRPLIKYVTDTNLRQDIVNKLAYPCGNKELLLKHFGKGSDGYGQVILTSACIAGVIASQFAGNRDKEHAIRKERKKLDALIPEDDPESCRKLAEMRNAEAERKQAQDVVRAAKSAQRKAESTIRRCQKSIPVLLSKWKEQAAICNDGGTAARQKSCAARRDAWRKAVRDLAAAEKAEAEAETALAEAGAKEEDAKDTAAALKKELRNYIRDQGKRELIQKKIRSLSEGTVSEDEMYQAALREASWYRDNFSDFYMEIQYHGLEDEQRVMPILVRVARELHIPLVAANDAHMVRGTDDDVLARTLIRATMFNHFTPTSASDHELYMKSEEELTEALSKLKIPTDAVEEAMRNVGVIADMCHCEVPNELHHPKFDSPYGEDDVDAIYRLCREGQAKLFGDAWTDEQEKRLRHELTVINTMGFNAYFLNLVRLLPYAEWLGKVPKAYVPEIPKDYRKLIPWCKQHGFDTGMGVGPGRGSGAGSIVCELLGITKLNPLSYDLLFERFLNPERVSMPDIDTDVRKATRQIFIDYIRQIFGDRAVSLIQTTSTLKAREAIRAAARIRSLETRGDTASLYAVGDPIARRVPKDPHAKLADVLDELKAAFPSEDEQAIIHYATLIEGAKTGIGPHAAGVVIFDKPDLSDYIPLGVNVETQTWITQCDMNDVEAHGMLKMDMLGLNTLDIITNTMQTVKDRHGVRLTLEDMTRDDPDVYRDIAEGWTDCVFQLGGEGMQNTMKQMHPNCFEDITAGIALYRPGPMEYIPEYIRGHQNPDAVVYDDPRLEPILKSTYGVLVYQEQVMQALQVLAGYSLGGADIVRRAMSKKKKKVIEEERNVFLYGNKERNIPGAIANGVPQKTAEKVYDKIEAFAAYAFNKSHAAAYAKDTYITAWLQHHYPIEFYCGTLNEKALDFVPVIYKNMQERGIAMALPDINTADAEFTVKDDHTILYGLGHIKGVAGAAQAIVAERNANGPFVSVEDFVLRTGVKKDVFADLIDAGAFDNLFPRSRSVLRAYAETLLGLCASYRKAERALQTHGDAALADLEMAKAAFGMAASLPEKSADPDNLTRERDMLGIYLSGDPLDEVDVPHKSSLIDIRNISEPRRYAIVFGIVTNFREIRTKRGDTMAVFSITDRTGTLRAVAFPKAYEKMRGILDDGVIIEAKGDITEDNRGSGDDEDVPEFQIQVASLTVAKRKIQTIYIHAKSEEDMKMRVNSLLYPYTIDMRTGAQRQAGLRAVIYLEDSGKQIPVGAYVSKEIEKDPLIFPRGDGTI